MQFQIWVRYRRGPVRFDQSVGSPATKAAENAALMANEDLQLLPKITSRLFPRYLGALLARLGKSNRNRLLAAGHSAALAAFARTQRAALFAVDRALHALAGRFAVSCHYAPPVFRFAELLRLPLRLWLSLRCFVRRHLICKHV